MMPIINRFAALIFLINDIAQSSLQQALTIEKAYDESRIPGLMYCTVQDRNLAKCRDKRPCRII